MDSQFNLPSKEGARHAARVQSNQQGGTVTDGGRPCGSHIKPDYKRRSSELATSGGGLIAPDDIEVLKLSMPLVLEHYGILDHRRNFSSPWREDRNPSAHVIPGTCLVHDFGTDETVDAFGLVGKMEDINFFPDQVRRVAEITGYSLNPACWSQPPANASPQRPRFEVPGSAGFPEVPRIAYEAAAEDLLANEQALAYLNSRGITTDKARQNMLGYVSCPQEVDGRFTLYEPVPTMGYILFPYPVDKAFSNVNYAVVRAIPGDTPPEHKAIRPTGVKAPLYREWLLRCGLKVLYVAEGLIDCLSVELLFHRACIALGGIGTRRLAALLYYTKQEFRPQKVIIALDADEAGRAASEKLASDLSAIGVKNSILRMADGCKDANDMLMKAGGLR